MTETQQWFAVRCLFTHPNRAKDGDGQLYQERITLWNCGSWDEAYRLARVEAETYATFCNTDRDRKHDYTGRE